MSILRKTKHVLFFAYQTSTLGTDVNKKHKNYLNLYPSRTITNLQKDNFTLNVHPEAFHKLEKLTSVKLQNLGISELPEQMFRDSTQLRSM